MRVIIDAFAVSNGNDPKPMTLALSYLSIHAIFVLPPIVVLGWFASRRDHARWSTRALTGLGVILVLAVVYTTPWDNLLIAEGVWWYGTGSVRATIWHAPVEEYLFSCSSHF